MARRPRRGEEDEGAPAPAPRLILFAPGALQDLERIVAFNDAQEPRGAKPHLEAIRGSLSMLSAHPELGRRLGGRSTLRELVISFGKTGHVALYEFSAGEARIRVVAIRHQREAGCAGGAW